jgi:acyl-CoA reductase-like NAD-dependent aldehyde dehydrogenase
LNVVNGYGEEVGNALASHPGVDKIAFTGSCEVGQLVRKASGLKRCTLELGGKSANIIMKDANMDAAIE